VLCHNDLAQHNIMVDPETLQPVAILDWEYAGYYPPEVEACLWYKPYNEQVIDEKETLALLEFFQGQEWGTKAMVFQAEPCGLFLIFFPSPCLSWFCLLSLTLKIMGCSYVLGPQLDREELGRKKASGPKRHYQEGRSLRHLPPPPNTRSSHLPLAADSFRWRRRHPRCRERR
jgi:hypothetical protein